MKFLFGIIICIAVAKSLKIGSRHTQNRFIYIDLGAHDGLSIDTFLPTESSALISSSRKTNTAMDGSSAVALDERAFFMKVNDSHHHPMFDKRNYEIVAVEANPSFTPQLEKQKRRYDATKIAKSYSLFNGTGISTKNGVGHLILDCAGAIHAKYTYIHIFSYIFIPIYIHTFQISNHTEIIHIEEPYLHTTYIHTYIHTFAPRTYKYRMDVFILIEPTSGCDTGSAGSSLNR